MTFQTISSMLLSSESVCGYLASESFLLFFHFHLVDSRSYSGYRTNGCVKNAFAGFPENDFTNERQNCGKESLERCDFRLGKMKL